MANPPDRGRPQPWLILLEAVLSVVAVGLVLLLPLHYLGSHLCAFAECSVPGPDEIRVYRVIVAALAVAVTATVVLAVRCRGRWAFGWHALVALGGVTSALLFAMPSNERPERAAPRSRRGSGPPSAWRPPPAPIG